MRFPGIKIIIESEKSPWPPAVWYLLERFGAILHGNSREESSKIAFVNTKRLRQKQGTENEEEQQALQRAYGDVVEIRTDPDSAGRDAKTE